MAASRPVLLWVSAVILGCVHNVPSALGEDCSEEQLNKAKLRFKDCMEDKKAMLLQLDHDASDDATATICSGLKDLSTGCMEAVNEFSFCKGREHVDHLVAIHLNAISDVLAPFHPSIDLKSCPVFNTPAPIIVKHHPLGLSDPEPAAEPEYEPITGSATRLITAHLALLIAALLPLL